MPWRGLHRMGMCEGYGQLTADQTLNRQFAGCVREFCNNAHTGCILGIKKEAPQKTWRFLHFAGVGAGFLLSRTAVSFTAEDSSIYPAPVQIRATPPPGNITTRNKISSKNYLVAFQMLGLLMTLVNTFRYSLWISFYDVWGTGSGEIRGCENRMQGWTRRGLDYNIFSRDFYEKLVLGNIRFGVNRFRETFKVPQNIPDRDHPNNFAGLTYHQMTNPPVTHHIVGIPNRFG